MEEFNRELEILIHKHWESILQYCNEAEAEKWSLVARLEREGFEPLEQTVCTSQTIDVVVQ